MSSTAIAIRDAVTEMIEDAAITGVAPESAIMPILNPSDVTTSLSCKVIASECANTTGVRGNRAALVVVEVVMQIRVSDAESEVPPLLESMESIAALFPVGAEITYDETKKAGVQSAESSPLYDVESLHSHGVFMSSLAVTMKAYNP